MAGLQQFFNEIAADETGGACNQDFHDGYAFRPTLAVMSTTGCRKDISRYML